MGVICPGNFDIRDASSATAVMKTVESTASDQGFFAVRKSWASIALRQKMAWIHLYHVRTVSCRVEFMPVSART